MAVRTITELKNQIDTLFPDNQNMEISAMDVRDGLIDIVDSMAFLLDLPEASETQEGVLEIATDDESIDETVDDKAIVPSHLGEAAFKAVGEDSGELAELGSDGEFDDDRLSSAIARLAGPAFTGNPTAPTQSSANDSARIATTAFVVAAIAAAGTGSGVTLTQVNSAIDDAISDLIDGAPGALDTLNELAEALGDDDDYAATIMAALALKANLSSPAFMGTPTAPTQSSGNDSTRLATTAFVQAVIDALAAADIPDLPASKTTSGTFGTARIPNLAATKITSGILAIARIPDLAATKITSGIFGTARIPDLNASKITGGTLNDARLSSAIARLASPALTGNPTAPTQADSNDSTRLATTAFVKTAVDGVGGNGGGGESTNEEFTLIVDGATAISSTALTVTDWRDYDWIVLVLSGSNGNFPMFIPSPFLERFEGDNFWMDFEQNARANIALTTNTDVITVSGLVGVSGYPASDDTWDVLGWNPAKGVVGENEISDAIDALESSDFPDLPASIIATGILALARIPNLPASKTTSGIFGTARIPDLNASKITGGTLARPWEPSDSERLSKITVSTSDPVEADLDDGELYLKYSA